METRLMTERQALIYCQLGRTAGREWLREIGARRTFGRSVRYDRSVVDSYLDRLDDEARQQVRG